jgi:resuscitation-promoting factor RpfA
MTEERDPKVSAAYRDLGAEEPPRALDDAILAAARRDAGARPAVLGARAGRQRWYAPLATAAVLVLAVATTLNMQLERPGIESPARQEAPAAAKSSSTVADAQPKKEVEVKPDAVAETRAKDTAQPQPGDEGKNLQRKFKEQSAPVVATAPAAPEPKPFGADQPAVAASPRFDESLGAASVTGKLARQAEERSTRDAAAGARAPQAAEVDMLAKRAEEDSRLQMQQRQAPASAPAPAPMRERAAALSPEQELDRIAELRAQGRHDDADKALAEFRKRYPDYRIPEAMRLRVERR